MLPDTAISSSMYRRIVKNVIVKMVTKMNVWEPKLPINPIPGYLALPINQNSSPLFSVKPDETKVCKRVVKERMKADKYPKLICTLKRIVKMDCRCGPWWEPVTPRST